MALYYIVREKFLDELGANSYFFVLKNKKIYGPYYKNKENKIINIYNFRRGIQYHNEIIKVKKIRKNKFNLLYRKLYKINKPQLSSDILLVKNNSVTYFITSPFIKIFTYKLLLNEVYLENLKRDINIGYLENNLKEIGYKIYNIFFSNIVFLKKDTRYITILSDKKLSFIPFEIAYNGKEFLFERHIISRDFIYEEERESQEFPLKEYSSFLSVCAVKYNAEEEFGDEVKYRDIAKYFNMPLFYYKKKFKASEFIKILENSRIFYFSGHSEFKKNKLYLKLSDKNYYLFQDFLSLSFLPEVLILNFCMDIERIEKIENIIKELLKKGVKNIIISYLPVFKIQNKFFFYFFKFFSKNRNIGEAFFRSIKFLQKTNNHEWIYYRLYGNLLNNIYNYKNEYKKL